jgi:two-component system, OmpR family, sensor histidine kinase KdpD
MQSSCATSYSDRYEVTRVQMGSTVAVPAAAPNTDRWEPQIIAALPCALSVLAVCGCTWISFRLGLSLGSAGFLYLIFVVLTAFYGGFWQATLVSVIAAAGLDYFFDEPIFSFSVGKLADWVELGAFEFTALVISELSNRVQLRASEAIAERRDTDRLYQTARRLLLLESPGDPGSLVSLLVRETFDLRGVVLFDSRSTKIHETGHPAPEAIGRVRDAFFGDVDTFDAEEQTWFCALRIGKHPMGAMALCGTDMRALAATALASLVAIALERAHTLEKQYHAEAARQAEQLRSAVLDSLAHQFKTPLTVIRTASSGIPAAGGLSEAQTELVSLIDQEARKLNELASRLVSAPKLESEELEGEPEPLILSRLMKTALQEVGSEDRDRFRLQIPAQEPPVFADRELVLTALAQLVDNALKYSAPESPIDVRFTMNGSGVVLAVRSQGLVVSAADRERIFERFYRAPGARERSSGTGLGLSIVKSIAANQRGHVWAEGEPGYGTVFSLALPGVPGAAQ